MAGLKVSEKGFKGDVASLLLMAAMLGLALASIFAVIEALKHRFSMLYPALVAAALLCGVAGGALSRNWIDAWRSVLNGVVIASGYLAVYFIDALIEDHASRTWVTVGRIALCGGVLVLALRGLERLPPPPLDPEDFR